MGPATAQSRRERAQSKRPNRPATVTSPTHLLRRLRSAEGLPQCLADDGSVKNETASGRWAIYAADHAAPGRCTARTYLRARHATCVPATSCKACAHPPERSWGPARRALRPTTAGAGSWLIASSNATARIIAHQHASAAAAVSPTPAAGRRRLLPSADTLMTPKSIQLPPPPNRAAVTAAGRLLQGAQSCRAAAAAAAAVAAAPAANPLSRPPACCMRCSSRAPWLLLSSGAHTDPPASGGRACRSCIQEPAVGRRRFTARLPSDRSIRIGGTGHAALHARAGGLGAPHSIAVLGWNGTRPAKPRRGGVGALHAFWREGRSSAGPESCLHSSRRQCRVQLANFSEASQSGLSHMCHCLMHALNRSPRGVYTLVP